MIRLSAIAERLMLNPRLPDGASEVGEDPEIIDVTHDSMQVTSGTLFCCVSGSTFDGHEFAAGAVADGAVAVMCERPLGLGVPELLVADTRAAMAVAAALVHGEPSELLRVIGVTGTNGKTTVVSLVRSVLASAGRRAGLVGTLTGARTTPESTDLQRTLAAMADEGITDVAIEVSSHALVQHRVDQVHFDIAVFTNLGSDHLDFHETPEAYFAAKAKLFEPERSRIGIVLVDDVHGRLLQDASGGRFRGVSVSDAANLTIGDAGSGFDWKGVRMSLPLIGRHNVVNALLAAEVCLEIGLTPQQIGEGLAAIDVIPGRFERFAARTPDAGNYSVIVDFAHTPDALENALEAAREVAAPDGRVTVVFGCGGDRDHAKRPMMGSVASELADRVIVTTDNPRSEDPAEIIREVVGGAGSARVEVIEDRRDAIEAALADCREGDVVLIAGKGHESGQEFADRIENFDDREVVRSLIQAEPTP